MDGQDDRNPLEGLEERLHGHAKAFESLLALTPARDYYGSQIVDGQDPSEQWNRKKQTKEQKQAAKKAKLDPANQKSALDVMREREEKALQGKRKREESEAVADGDAQTEKVEGASKRRRSNEDADASEAKRREKAEKRKEKRQKKTEKNQDKKAKAEAKKAAKQDADLADAQSEKKQTQTAEDGDLDVSDANDDDDDAVDESADLDKMDFSGLADDAEEDGDDTASEDSSVPTTPAVNSPAFDTDPNQSTASSSSSIVPPSKTEPQNHSHQPKTTSQKPRIDTHTASAATASKPTDPASGTQSPKLQLPDVDHAQLQERLRKRIEELRVKRKADGDEGKPAKSRQELLEQRRKKDEQRKAAKKAQRQKQKEDEQRKRDEQLRGSGSPLSSDIFSPAPKTENNYSFSRLAFDDGTSTDPSLTHLQDPKKKKGPQDTRTALQAAQNKQARLAGYDAEKQADIGQKDMWLNAKKRAHGERVRDDTSLLKKALKRKEKQKGRSEKEWKEREATVVKGKEMKQKKRETNLAKRRDEKGQKGKKKPSGAGAKKGGSGGKKGGRPGFEGRFKA